MKNPHIYRVGGKWHCKRRANKHTCLGPARKTPAEAYAAFMFIYSAYWRG